MDAQTQTEIAEDFRRIDLEGLPHLTKTYYGFRVKPKPYRSSHQWPEPTEQVLIELHQKGLSFGQIGQRLGMTRSAVSGKVGRLKARGLL